jgi:heptosyltransferase-2/heptosyltransferase-3
MTSDGSAPRESRAAPEREVAALEREVTHRASRPLVVRLGVLGDMVMLAPALRAFTARRGIECDLVVGSRRAAEVFEGTGWVGDVLPLHSRSTPYWLASNQRALVAWLRSRPPGPVWVLDSSPKLLRLLELGGVDRRSCVLAENAPRGDLEHAVPYALRVLALEPGDEARSVPPVLDLSSLWADLGVSERERADCDAWLASRGCLGAPLVLFQTLSRTRDRGRWPRERWVELARAVLHELPGARVLLLGSPNERRPVRALAEACRHARVLDVAGELSVRQLAALCERAHSCVSLDTGPAHVAAAAGCPLVVLVGRADPRRNRPLGPAPIRLVTAWPEERWPPTRAEWEATHRMGDLPLEAVWNAWTEVASELAARRDGELRGRA